MEGIQAGFVAPQIYNRNVRLLLNVRFREEQHAPSFILSVSVAWEKSETGASNSNAIGRAALPS
jgi:hypothetical protein